MTAEEYNKSVDDYADGLYRFLLKNIRDAEKARDLVQESFEKLWTRLPYVDSHKVKSYLFTTAHHTMIDWIRKERRISELDVSRHDFGIETDIYTGLSEILDNALKRLPVDQRTVLLLRDYEGYRYDEIAEITGLSESQVKVYIFRGRMFLKNYIQSVEKVI
jgi:RNA polymerase sigma-70 factor (ECF subfamily)